MKTPREVRLALRYVLLNARKHAVVRAARDSSTVVRSARATLSGRHGAEGRVWRAEGHAHRAESHVLHAGVPVGFVDECSSAAWFVSFARPAELAFGARAVRSEWLRTSGSTDPPVAAASLWLLRAGAIEAGAFDLDETPGG